MFNLTPNNRSYQVKFISDLVYSFVQHRMWPIGHVIITHKGKSGASNMRETLASFLEEGKIYDFGGKKLATETILAKAELYDQKHAKKCAIVLEGRHRCVAKWIAETFFDVVIEPEISEANDDMAGRVALEANLVNEQFAKMLNTEKLQGIIEAIKADVYKKQTDLPVKRGQQQTLWHRAMAVIVQGVSVEDAGKLTAKEAADVEEGKLQLAQILEEKESGKNAKKVLPGEKIRALATMAKNYDQSGTSHLSQLLDAIISNGEMAAKVAVKAYFDSVKN